MARTKLFKQVQRALRAAGFASQKKMSDSHVREMIESAQYDASRRQLLKYAAGATAAMAVTPPLRMFGNAYAQNMDPVLIIGAGAAGLAAAYHLKSNGIPFRIAEWNKRVGGRIITVNNFNNDGMFIERGGELIDTNHYTMRGLARDLGVETETFERDLPGITAEIFHFEGKVYKDADLVLGLKEFAEKVKAANDEIYGGTDHDIDAKNIDKLPKAAVDFDNMSIRELLEKSSDLMPSWIRAALDVAFTCENGLEADRQSSINLIDVLDTDFEDGFEMFGESDEAMRIKGGNERLIEALKAKLDLVEGKNLMYGARLKAISRNPDGSLKCTFDGLGTKAPTVKAQQVICAIPFTTLRDVEGLDKLGLQPKKLECINNLGYGTNSKMMIGFETAFWRNAKRSPHPCDGSMYTEGPSAQFWDTSRLQVGRDGQPGKNGILTNFSAGAHGVKIASLRGDTTQAVNIALADLGKIFGNELVRQQYAGRVAIQPWPAVPFVKGSYSIPTTGQFMSIMGYNGDAELDGQLHFAGEHTESSFGYMNSALESGFRVANEILEKLGRNPVPAPGADLEPKKEPAEAEAVAE